MARCFACCHNGELSGVELNTAIPNPQRLGLSLETSSLGSEQAEEELSEQPDPPNPAKQFEDEEDNDKDRVAVTQTVTQAELASKLVEKVVALEPQDQNILRAVTIRNVLSKRGSIFENSTGSAETYLLSKPRQWIDIFISHNWSVPRWKKFWALAIYVNIIHAVVAAYIGVAIGCFLNVASVPPALYTSDKPMRLNCIILGTLGFWGTLMFGHDFPLVGRLFQRRQVFLDKVCIHQTDPDLKAQGIQSLGAFLRYSKEMLVLFNVAYCKRLWTVYEIACYMYLHPKHKVQMMPVDIASVVWKSTALINVLQWFYRVEMHLSVVFGIAGHFPMIAIVMIMIVLIFVLAFIIRKWAVQQAEFLSDLRTFQIAKAQCVDENDRVIVSRNISAFVRSMNLVGEEATDDDALSTFDKLVQERMPEFLRNATGYVGFPYKYALLAGMGRDYFTFDRITSDGDASTLLILSWLVDHLMVRAAVLPSVFLVCAMMSKALKFRKGWAEVGVKCGIAVTVFFVTLIGLLTSIYLQRFAMESVRYLIGHAVLSVVLTLVVAKLFAWTPAPTKKALAELSWDGELGPGPAM